MTSPDSISEETMSDTNPAGSPGPALPGSVMAVLILILAGGLLAPIWTVPFPPLMDYPNHLASAFVLAHLHDAAYHFSQFFSANWNTFPYLAMDVLLVGLQRFMSIDLAGRLFLSLTVLSVPAAAWFFIRRANPGQENLVFWSLLVCNNLYFFRFGFLNVQLSMGICFLLVGLWLWYLDHPSVAKWCLLLLVSTALYFTHILGFAVAGVVMTAYAWSARRTLKDLAYAWALYIPGAVCYLHAVVGHGPRGAVQFRAITDKIGSLVAVMVGCSPIIDLLTLAALLGVLAWAQIDNPDFEWNRPWRRTTWILFLFYWLLPAAIGPATNVDKRLLPFVFVLSLAGAKVGRRGRKLAMIAVALFLIRAGAMERYFVSQKPHLAKLSAAMSVIPPGSRVLPLVDWAGGAPMPERHFWAYGVIDRGWISPCLFHDPGVHPFALRPGTYDPCGLSTTPSTKLDWGRIGTEFDYVWAYKVPQYSAPLSSIGKMVFEGENLQVFQMGKVAGDGKEVQQSPTP
jgi:hypothetical protein